MYSHISFIQHSFPSKTHHAYPQTILFYISIYMHSIPILNVYTNTNTVFFTNYCYKNMTLCILHHSHV